MPHHPMTGPEFSLPIPEGTGQAETRPSSADSSGTGSGPSMDLLELAAKFSAQSGGGLSPQTSAALALEIVLNEIVEQACLATGANGAAIVALRDGEMICRASNGAMAPELGARLNLASGISGECIIHHQVQRCDDTETDPLADVEASRRLGVRSVVVYPLLKGGDLIGILEIFSSRVKAFGQRDERTLEALAHRVLKSFERAAAPAQAPPKIPPSAATLAEECKQKVQKVQKVQSDPVEDLRFLLVPEKKSSDRTFDAMTLVSTFAVMACIAALGILVGQRFGWAKFPLHSPASERAAISTGEYPSPASMVAPAAKASTGKAGISAGMNASMHTPSAGKAAVSGPPVGGLSVYENGKEVFRMAPSAGVGGQSTAEQGSGVENAAAIETDRILHLSQAAAEDELLYRLDPDYPDEARKQGIQGAVVLDARIGTNGYVQEVKLVNGPPLLADAAKEAVKKWQFRSKVVHGIPVEMETRITLNFRLPQ